MVAVTKRKASYAYRAYLDRRRREGRWMPLWPADLATLTQSQALLISHVLNVGQSNADDHGWVMLTPSFVVKGLKMEAECQSKVIRRLCRKGILEVSNRGPNGSRHVRLDLNALDKLLGRGRQA
jgi:hypothetical protein